jgi:hypothetical protein
VKYTRVSEAGVVSAVEGVERGLVGQCDGVCHEGRWVGLLDVLKLRSHAIDGDIVCRN